MATSGSSDWTLNRTNIITQVLQINEVLAVGDTPTPEQVKFVSQVLNQFVKSLQIKYKVKFWKLSWDTKIFSAPSEVTGSDALVYTCIKSHTSSSVNTPITGDDWSTYWIVKGSTGGVWADATSYTSAGDFTDSDDIIGIERAYMRRGGIDRSMEIIGDREYAEIANKNSFGEPSRLWFNNKLSPTIYINPQVEDEGDVVIHYQKILRIQDFDKGADTPDFPVDWLEPIVWGVAHKVGVTYGVPISKLREIEKIAIAALADVLASVLAPTGPMRVQPNLRDYQ